MPAKYSHALDNLCTFNPVVFNIYIKVQIIIKIYGFFVTDYVYGVDYDLQARARSAIEAERFAYQS